MTEMPRPKQKKLVRKCIDKTPSLTKPKFNTRQLGFMRSYVVCGNATQAALEAGYSKNGAAQTAAKLLRNTNIKEMIDATLLKVGESQMVKAEEVIAHTKVIGLSNMFDYIQFDEKGTPSFNLAEVARRNYILGANIAQLEIIEEKTKFGTRVKTKLKLMDKKDALNKLDAVTGAFRVANKGVDEESAKIVIHVNTGIPGAPGSMVRRDPVDVTAEIMNGD